MQKVKKVKSVDIQSDCKTMRKKRTDSSWVFTHSQKVWNDYEITSKNEQIKRKPICSVCAFCKSILISRKQVQDC